MEKEDGTMDGKAEEVTLDDVELMAWRILGAKDADTVDKLLKTVQAYADGQTWRMLRGTKNYPYPIIGCPPDGSPTDIVPLPGGVGRLDEFLNPGNMLDVVQYAREEANRIARIREQQVLDDLFRGNGSEGGGGPESAEKSMLFEGGGSKSVEKSMLFSPEENTEPSGDEEDGESEIDFLGMLRDVVAEGKAEKDTAARGKTVQTCSRCRKEKPVEEFSRDASKVSGRRSHCKVCVVERNTERKRETGVRNC